MPFASFAASVQAFVQPMQAPDIARMLARAWQGLIKSQIGTIHRLCLGILARIHQQGAKRMAGGLHPAPWLVIKHAIVQPHRIEKLIEGARAFFPDLGPPDRDWMGFRPSLPDSLPVIGPSRAGAEVIHAYGHGHVGLTLAPVTARFVADLVAGRSPGHEIEPCLPTRF